MAGRKAAAPAAPPLGEAVDPSALYDVAARERFRHKGIGFGSLSTTELRGGLLTDLLASEHAGKVVGYTRRGPKG